MHETWAENCQINNEKNRRIWVNNSVDYNCWMTTKLILRRKPTKISGNIFVYIWYNTIRGNFVLVSLHAKLSLSPMCGGLYVLSSEWILFSPSFLFSVKRVVWSCTHSMTMGYTSQRDRQWKNSRIVYTHPPTQSRWRVPQRQCIRCYEHH